MIIDDNWFVNDDGEGTKSSRIVFLLLIIIVWKDIQSLFKTKGTCNKEQQ